MKSSNLVSAVKSKDITIMGKILLKKTASIQEICDSLKVAQRANSQKILHLLALAISPNPNDDALLSYINEAAQASKGPATKFFEALGFISTSNKNTNNTINNAKTYNYSTLENQLKFYEIATQLIKEIPNREQRKNSPFKTIIENFSQNFAKNTTYLRSHQFNPDVFLDASPYYEKSALESIINLILPSKLQFTTMLKSMIYAQNVDNLATLITYGNKAPKEYRDIIFTTILETISNIESPDTNLAARTFLMKHFTALPLSATMLHQLYIYSFKDLNTSIDLGFLKHMDETTHDKMLQNLIKNDFPNILLTHPNFTKDAASLKKYLNSTLNEWLFTRDKDIPDLTKCITLFLEKFPTKTSFSLSAYGPMLLNEKFAPLFAQKDYNFMLLFFSKVENCFKELDPKYQHDLLIHVLDNKNYQWLLSLEARDGAQIAKLAIDILKNPSHSDHSQLKNLLSEEAFFALLVPHCTQKAFLNDLWTLYQGLFSKEDNELTKTNFINQAFTFKTLQHTSLTFKEAYQSVKEVLIPIKEEVALIDYLERSPAEVKKSWDIFSKLLCTHKNALLHTEDTSRDPCYPFQFPKDISLHILNLATDPHSPVKMTEKLLNSFVDHSAQKTSEHSKKPTSTWIKERQVSKIKQLIADKEQNSAQGTSVQRS